MFGQSESREQKPIQVTSRETNKTAYFNTTWELGAENSRGRAPRSGHASPSSVYPSIPFFPVCSVSVSFYQQHLHELLLSSILFSTSQFTSSSFCFDFHSKSLTLILSGEICPAQKIFVAKPQDYKCLSHLCTSCLWVRSLCSFNQLRPRGLQLQTRP